MVEQRPYKPQVAGSSPALERKDASAVESESGLIPECFGTIRASAVPQGWRRSVGFARWSNAPWLPARQTEDECREDQLQTGIATSIKRQPRWLTQLRLRPGCVETSGSCVRQDAANPIKGPARKLYSQVSIFRSISVERYTSVFQTEVERALLSCSTTECSLKVRRLLRE